MSEEDKPSFGQDLVEAGRQRFLDEARRAYELALNRIWAGNAAGIFAALGAFISGKAQSSLIFVALLAFTVGLATLAIGAIWSLIAQTRILRSYENAEGMLDLPVEAIRRPSAAAGLAWCDLRTVMAIISGLCFFIGVGFGLGAAYRVLGMLG